MKEDDRHIMAMPSEIFQAWLGIAPVFGGSGVRFFSG
jgi:hypothetical protein